MMCSFERMVCHFEWVLAGFMVRGLVLWDLRMEREIRAEVRKREMQRVSRRPVGIVMVVCMT